MKFLFDDEDNIKRLETFCGQWEGTPFRHHSGQCGFGCDCIHFIIRGLEYLGFTGIDIPWYSSDWHLHMREELLLEGLRENVPGVELRPDNPKDGDLILYKFGHVMSHVGWFLNNHVWQASVGVRLRSRIWEDEYWHKRRMLIYRVYMQ